MIPKYLMFAVGLVALPTVAVATMEIAILSQMQQDADARGYTKSIAINASLGRCFKPDLQAENADESDDEEEEDDE